MKPYVKKLSAKGREIYDAFVYALRHRAHNMLAEEIPSYDFHNDEFYHLEGFCSGASYALPTYEEYKVLEDALYEEFKKVMNNYDNKWEVIERGNFK